MIISLRAGESRGEYHTDFCTVTYHSVQVLSLQYCTVLRHGNQLLFLARLLQFGFLDLPFCCHCTPSSNSQPHPLSHLKLAYMFKKPTSAKFPMILDESCRTASHRLGFDHQRRKTQLRTRMTERFQLTPKIAVTLVPDGLPRAKD